MTTYSFNLEFRKRILASMLDEYVFAAFGNVIKPQYFELEKEIKISRELNNFYDSYERVPEEDELLSCFEWNEEEQDLIFELYDLYQEGELDFAIDKAIQFAKEQSMKIALLDSVDDLNKGDTKTPLQRVEDAMKIGTDYLDLGTDFLGDIDFWLEELEISRKIPTGMIHLDNSLEGGLAKGECGIFLGPPNRRKTQALVNVGYGAMSIFSSKSVVHITLELSETVVAKRYAARLVSEWYNRGMDGSEYKQLVLEKASKLLKGRLIIKEFPSGSASVADVRMFLKKLKMTGHEFDLVIIDYLDEMHHPGKGELRHRLADSVRGLRALGHPTQLDLAVWTATQANRSSLIKETITMEDISESFGKAAVADVIIALCETKVETSYDLMRLYGAKVRDGFSGWYVYCKTHDASHAIMTIEKKDHKEILNAGKEQDTTRVLEKLDGIIHQ